MALLLKNATFVDWQTLEFKKTDILVHEGINKDIEFVDKNNSTSLPYSVSLDCTGKLVTKSFAVGHHHAYSALARGMPAPAKSPASFYEILQYIWWQLDKSLDKEMIKASAQATAIACAKAGSTFVIDHHASPNYITGSLEIIAEAFEKVGIDHLLCYEISDRDGKDKAEKGLEETADYLNSRNGLVGLHASFTIGDETMRKAADLSQKYKTGVHIHVAEDQYDQKHCLENYQKTVVERLNDFGFLDNSSSILVHCLHLSEKERDIIAGSNAYIAQNTESNLNNNVGYFNAEGLGNRIMLGTDGMHSDMLQSAKAAYFVGQGFDKIDMNQAYKRFREVHNYLTVNSFSGDSNNNLVILDYDSPTEISQANFIGHFIYGVHSNHIRHVISNGKLIVKDRKVQTIDEMEVLTFTRKQASRLWDRYSNK